MRLQQVGALLLLAALLLAGAEAGKYKGGRLGKARALPKEQRYFNHREAPLMKEEDLPKNFDWCDKDGVNFCVSSWNQHIPQYCGSCYLHSTLSMIADRMKIAKGGKAHDVMLGRQTFLNCAPPAGYSNGCDGGDVIDVVRYMAEVGLPDEGCMPYSATDYTAWNLRKHDKCPAIARCTNCMPLDGKETCWPVKKPVVYKLKAYGQVGPTEPGPKNVAAMMSEIFHRGPIVCGLTCPDDFTWTYDGGIFNDTSGDEDVDHDVEVVGWGEEDGVRYWKIRNSWGQYWGKNGFFRIVRGRNAQMLENGDCWYADPTWEVEEAVENGTLTGSMWGVITNPNHKAAGQIALDTVAKLRDGAAEAEEVQESVEEQEVPRMTKAKAMKDRKIIIS